MSEKVERSDAWSASDDLILADTVLTHIRSGSTQLNAFEEAGERLQRTPAACGFRWNATVRKEYYKQIQEAKEERHNSKSTTRKLMKVSSVPTHVNSMSEFDRIIRFMEELRVTLDHKDTQILSLQNELNEARGNEISIGEDYQTLLKIMEKARQLGALNAENAQSPRFKMDSSGNFERIS